MTRILTLLFSMCCIFFLTGGNAAYRKYSINDGLLNNQILRIWIDSRGYIWGDTWEGGFRFDGNFFYNFREKENDRVLRSSFLYFYETESSVVVGTRRGVAFFEAGGVSTYLKDGPSIEHFRRIDNRLYVIRRDSIFSMDLNEREFCNEFISLTDDVDLGLFSAKSDNLEILKSLTKRESHYGLYKYTIKEGLVVNSVNDKEKSREDQFCTRLKNEDILEHIPYLKDVLIWDVLTDNNGVTWVASEQGLLRIPPPAFVNYTKNDGLPNYVWSICEDTNGDMWFATYGNGIYKYKNGDYVQENIINLEKEQYIMHYYIGATQTSTGFFLPHARGVLKRENGKWMHVKELPKTQYLCVYNDEKSKTVFYAGADTLTIQRDDKWEKYSSRTLLKNCPLTITKDKKDRYWMGAGSPSTVHIYKNGEFIDVDSDEVIFPGGIFSSDIDNKGNLWFGNSEGLYNYSYNKVDTIGLKRISTIAAIKCYNDSIILASGRDGLHCINLEKYYNNDLDYYTFFSSDMGLTVEGLGQHGLFFDSKGGIWIISSSGITRFYPERVVLPQQAPESIIYSIKFSSPTLEWQKKDLLFSDKSKTLYLQSPICNIEIDFGAISTSVNGGVLYSFRLEGYHDEWVETTKNTRFVVTNLPPGSYKFTIRSLIEKGNFVGPEKHISFVIKPLFWQTFTFKVLVMILVFLIILLFTYLFIRRSKKRILREMEITNIRLANIKSQLNPHFIFNTMNSIGADIIDTNNSSYDYYSMLARLIRKSLLDADRATKCLSDEIEFVREYLELQKYRFKSKLNYSIEVNSDVDQTMPIPKMSIQLLVENAVSHGLEAVDRVGVLCLRIEKDNKYVIISVSDNGVGFSKSISAKGNGTGLKNLRKMIDIYNLYNKQQFIIKIDSEENVGTNVYLFVPHGFSFLVK